MTPFSFSFFVTCFFFLSVHDFGDIKKTTTKKKKQKKTEIVLSDVNI